MYDSQFLSDGSYPLRGLTLAYSSIATIVFSLIYFVVAFIWEIKSSKQKKKTKRQVMWSKLKGMKHVAVEGYKKREKQEKLSSLMKVTRKPMKFDVQSLKNVSNPVGGKGFELMPPQLILPTSAPLAVLSGAPLPPSSLSSGDSLIDVGSDSSGVSLSDSSDRSSSKSSSDGQSSTESSGRNSSGSTDEATKDSEGGYVISYDASKDSEVGYVISYESELSKRETSKESSLSGYAGRRKNSLSVGSILEVASSVSDEDVGKDDATYKRMRASSVDDDAYVTANETARRRYSLSVGSILEVASSVSDEEVGKDYIDSKLDSEDYTRMRASSRSGYAGRRKNSLSVGSILEVASSVSDEDVGKDDATYKRMRASSVDDDAYVTANETARRKYSLSVGSILDVASSVSDEEVGKDYIDSKLDSEDEGLPIFTVDHLIAKPVLSTDSSSSDSSTSDSGSDSS